jgi:hypothetical protein
MKKNEEFCDLEKEIRSLPELDYNKKFTKDTQNAIHENLLQFARSYEKKKRRSSIMKKISVGLASVAALVLFAILFIPINEEHPSTSDSNGQGQQSNEHTIKDENKVDDDKDPNKQNETDDKLSDTILYENTEYGFTFALPKSWQGYQIVSDSWEGISNDQQQNNITENGPILLIRHPEWTEDKPRQDIPIMVFTLNQWNSIEKEEFHIGAAPIGPRILGQNNQYVFALPARYNFAFPEGYEEVEKILENDPLQSKNVEKDPSKIDEGTPDQLKSSLIQVEGKDYSFKYMVKNNSSNKVNLTFNTNQEFNYILWRNDAKGTMVYDYSRDKSYRNLFHEKTLAPGQELTYEIELSNTYEAGTYILEVYLTSNEPQEGSPSKYHQNLEFTITNSK